MVGSARRLLGCPWLRLAQAPPPLLRRRLQRHLRGSVVRLRPRCCRLRCCRLRCCRVVLPAALPFGLRGSGPPAALCVAAAQAVSLAVAAASALRGARDHLWRSGDALRTFCAVAWHVIRDNAAYLPSLVHHALICPKVERPNPIPAATARAATLRGVAHHYVGAVVVPRERGREKPRTCARDCERRRGADVLGAPADVHLNRPVAGWLAGCAEREHRCTDSCLFLVLPSFLPPSLPARPLSWWLCSTRVRRNLP